MTIETRDLYGAGWYELKVREALCTIKMVEDAVEMERLLGNEDPFDIEKKGLFSIVKKTYRTVYKPINLSRSEVDGIVRRAIELHEEGFRFEN